MWKVPVDKRIIETEFQPMPAAGFRHLSDKVPMRGHHCHAAVGSSLGIIHAETIMVLGRKHYGTHTSLLCQKSYCVSIKSGRVKILACSSIPIGEDAGKRLYLFTISLTYRFTVPYTPVIGIQTKMNEH